MKKVIKATEGTDVNATQERLDAFLQDSDNIITSITVHRLDRTAQNVELFPKENIAVLLNEDEGDGIRTTVAGGMSLKELENSVRALLGGYVASKIEFITNKSVPQVVKDATYISAIEEIAAGLVEDLIVTEMTPNRYEEASNYREEAEKWAEDIKEPMSAIKDLLQALAKDDCNCDKCVARRKKEAN